MKLFLIKDCYLTFFQFFLNFPCRINIAAADWSKVRLSMGTEQPILYQLKKRYAKTSSPAVQKRHSKVYGNPIAPSLYSILLPVLKFSNESRAGTKFFCQLSWRYRINLRSCVQYEARRLSGGCYVSFSWPNSWTKLGKK